MRMKSFVFKLCLLFWATVFFSSRLSGQSALQPIAPSIPTSPQAEAIQRYGDIAINYSTGTPDISIPLFEIDHRGYRLPVTLKYNPQPLRPGYNYDVYGQGWGLSIGSCVSRTISYIPDEWRNFKLDTDKLSAYYSIYKDAMMQQNFGYDIFNASLPDGSSFEFIIRRNDDNQLECVVSDNRSVKISFSYTTNNITAFTIIDEQGVKYSFNGADRPYRNSIGVTSYSNSYVSWQLTSIQLPNSSQPITFTYGQYMESDFTEFMNEAALVLHHDFYGFPPKGSVASVPDWQPYFYRMQLLTSVSYGSTRIRWEYETSGNVTGRNYADAIVVTDNDSLVRRIDLDHQTFGLTHWNNNDGSINKLQKVTVSGPSGHPLVYRCTYTSNGGYFMGTDHWGYLNHYQGNNDIALMNIYVAFDYEDLLTTPSVLTQLTKEADDPCPYDKLRLSAHTYDNRAPLGPEYHGVLSRLEYPTGGYTEFAFENHRFLSQTAENGDYIHDMDRRVEKKAAGFRIREITDYTAAGSVARVRTFAYGKGDANHLHTGLGEAVADPNVMTYSTGNSCAAFPIRYMLAGLSPYGQQVQFNDPFDSLIGMDGAWGWECSFGVGNFRRVLNGRPPVLYSEVTEYHGDIYSDYPSAPQKTTGKTVYKYDIYDNMTPDTLFFERTIFYGNTPSYGSRKYRYNTLLEKTDYVYKNSGYQMVRSDTYRWTPHYQLVYNYQYTNAYHPDFPPSGNATLQSYFTQKPYYIGGYELTSHTTKYEDPTYGVTCSEGFQYNIRNQLIQKTSGGSAGQLVSTYYSYPEAEGGSVMEAMVEKNMISPVLEERVRSTLYSGTATGEMDVAGTKTDYAAYTVGGNTLYLPSKVYALDAVTTGTDSGYVLSGEVLAYSANGNPRETVSADGVHTVYLWSYDDRYLIAEIRNATSAQAAQAVSAVFGKTVDELALEASPDSAKLKALRANANLAGAFVTTFTHRPLVGVASMTDPAGKTTYYTYDGMGRLLETYYYEGNTVSDANRRTLQQYEYQYYNQ